MKYGVHTSKIFCMQFLVKHNLHL